MKIKLLLLFFVLLASILILPKPVHAFNFFGNNVCKYQNENGQTSAVCSQAKQQDGKNPAVTVIKIVTNIVAIAAGVIAIIFIIISGFTLVTSAGNAEAVSNSKKRIVNSLIGLVIVSLAWTIITVITSRIIQ